MLPRHDITSVLFIIPSDIVIRDPCVNYMNQLDHARLGVHILIPVLKPEYYKTF